MKKFGVLIVEDHDSYRQLLSLFITQHFPSIRIAEAEDWNAALHSVVLWLPDLVFMDTHAAWKE